MAAGDSLQLTKESNGVVEEGNEAGWTSLPRRISLSEGHPLRWLR